MNSEYEVVLFIGGPAAGKMIEVMEGVSYWDYVPRPTSIREYSMGSQSNKETVQTYRYVRSTVTDEDKKTYSVFKLNGIKRPLFELMQGYRKGTAS